MYWTATRPALEHVAGPLVAAQELRAAPPAGCDDPSALWDVTPVDRPVGANDVGIVTWRLALRTPECPGGREVCLHHRQALLQQTACACRSVRVWSDDTHRQCVVAPGSGCAPGTETPVSSYCTSVPGDRKLTIQAHCS